MLLHMKMHSGIDANVSTRTSPNSEVAVSLPYCPVKQLNKELKVKVVPLLWATNSKSKHEKTQLSNVSTWPKEKLYFGDYFYRGERFTWHHCKTIWFPQIPL